MHSQDVKRGSLGRGSCRLAPLGRKCRVPFNYSACSTLPICAVPVCRHITLRDAKPQCQWSRNAWEQKSSPSPHKTPENLGYFFADACYWLLVGWGKSMWVTLPKHIRTNGKNPRTHASANGGRGIAFSHTNNRHIYYGTFPSLITIGSHWYIAMTWESKYLFSATVHFFSLFIAPSSNIRFSSKGKF